MADATPNDGTLEKPESRFLNSSSMEIVLEESRNDLGSVDSQGATRMLAHHWIDTMRDLRLLHKEELLMSLSTEIQQSILDWLEKECDKVFADDDGGDLLFFAYGSDMDKNGIIWYLGTNGGTRDFINPGHPRGGSKVRVRPSTLMHDSAPAIAAIGRNVVRCVTKPVKDSFFEIDFRPRKIRPTHYTLRHYSTWDTEALRFWVFEAQDSNGRWVILREHMNDDGLNARGAAHTWPLANVNEFYSLFRVRQTEFNSNQHYYLALSGFEIYGAMNEEEKGPERGGAGSLTFLPSYDFDTNGVVYWLGTSRGLENWQNPALRGLIKVFYSSLSKDSAPHYAVVGRDVVRCVTDALKNSWFCIDFGPVKIIPTHYSIRHYSSYDTECLRNWRLEGSNNSTNGADGDWVILETHRNDISLNAKGATKTWKLQAHIVNNEGYSKYRIFQFGPNSNQHHFLACSGFEIYGTVIAGAELDLNAMVEAEQPAGPSRKFVKQFDMDTNGLIYFLGTLGFQRAWANPMSALGVVNVTSSSIMSDSVPLDAVVGRSAVRCVTKPHNKSWIAIDLLDVKIQLTQYTIRHYSSWDTEALRYWNLEASNDGRSWLTIRQHLDDRSLRKAGGAHTWDVNCPQYFSKFRIFMTNRNSNNHWYLACSGVELYGNATGGIVSARHQAQPAGLAMNAALVAQNAQAASDQARAHNAPANNPIASELSLAPAPVEVKPEINWMEQPAPTKAKRSNEDALIFEYESELDGNGLCFWLGTKGNTSNWQNPSELGLIKLTSCGMLGRAENGADDEKQGNDPNDSAPISAIVGLDAVRCVTKAQLDAWICIDFGEYAIMPTFYMLRHYSSHNEEALRSWRFEGSCDGKEWDVIKEHKNDSTLDKKGKCHTWRVWCTQHYSKFRITQTGENSNKNNYLACSGFEIYGLVIRQHKYFTWDQMLKNKSKRLEVDSTTNSVYNINSRDTWQTVKVSQPFNFQQNPRQEFTCLMEKVAQTTNAWKVMVGVAPGSFVCSGNRQWLGSQASWGYIAGTGGKCFNVGKSIKYGSKYAEKQGDVVTCVVDCKEETIEYILNGVSQGIAFENFQVKKGSLMYPACSITATTGRVRLMERVTPKSSFEPDKSGAAAIGNVPPPQKPDPSGLADASAAFYGGNPANSPRAIPIKSMAELMKAADVDYGWDKEKISAKLFVRPDGVSVMNRGSGDRWEAVVSQTVFKEKTGKHSFEITIVADMKTSNAWKFIIGLVPENFDPRKTSWIGSQGSWGYIGGTGGKCHDVPKSQSYSKKYGQSDVIRCEIDTNKGTIHYFKNGKSLGQAFKKVKVAVRPAVSITGKNTCLKIGNVK